MEVSHIGPLDGSGKGRTALDLSIRARDPATQPLYPFVGRAARQIADLGLADARGEFRAQVDSNGFRRRRLRMLLDHVERHFAGKPLIRLLDVGGTRAYWMGMRDLWQHLPLEITLINLSVSEADDPPFLIRAGNACDLSQFPDASFDLVHSNSVIEHVGAWKDMTAMTGEIRRLARNYFIQTPNFWFPLEPHYRTWFFHWYPEVTRAQMLMRRKRGFRARQPELSAAMENIQSVRYWRPDRCRRYFPMGSWYAKSCSALPSRL